MGSGDKGSNARSGVTRLLLTSCCLLVLVGAAETRLRVSSTLREFCDARNRERVRVSRELGRRVRLPWDHIYGALNEYCRNPRAPGEKLLDIARRLAATT